MNGALPPTNNSAPVVEHEAADNRRSMMRRRSSFKMRSHSLSFDSNNSDLDNSDWLGDSSQSNDNKEAVGADRQQTPIMNRRAMLGRSKTAPTQLSGSSLEETKTPANAPVITDRRAAMKKSKSMRMVKTGSLRNIFAAGSGNAAEQESQNKDGQFPSRRETMKRSGSMRNLTPSCSLKDVGKSGSLRNLMGFMGSDNETSAEEPEPAKKEYLLDKLGGMTVLSTLIHDFEIRVFEDGRLKPFFDGVPHKVVLLHQRKLFAMAFTEIDDIAVIAGTIRKTHTQLFYRGLSEAHFDMIVQHLVDSLRSRRFNDNIINQVTGTIAPLRQIFEDEAEDFARHKRMESSENEAMDESY